MLISYCFIHKGYNYIHLFCRLLWLCSEFGLSITHKPHSLPDPEDLASSQIEIKQYQAKKAAVEKDQKIEPTVSLRPLSLV